MTITDSISRGLIYRVRYRAQNFNGWGLYSEIGYILAAQAPSVPPAPVYLGSTATTINLQFIPPADNGGAEISSYTLWIDTIQPIPAFRVSYTGPSLTYLVS